MQNESDPGSSMDSESSPQAVPSERGAEYLKRKIMCLRAAYANNMDQAFVAGDMSSFECYKKVVKNLDDKFVLVNKIGYCSLDLPPIPSGFSITINVPSQPLLPSTQPLNPLPPLSQLAVIPVLHSADGTIQIINELVISPLAIPEPPPPTPSESTCCDPTPITDPTNASPSAIINELVISPLAIPEPPPPTPTESISSDNTPINTDHTNASPPASDSPLVAEASGIEEVEREGSSSSEESDIQEIGSSEESLSSEMLIDDESEPCFTSVDPKPPQFPKANAEVMKHKWNTLTENVQMLLQFLIELDQRFADNNTPLNAPNIEKTCPGALLRLGCDNLFELIEREIILVNSTNFTYSLNPIIKEMRFIVLNDVEWTVFNYVRSDKLVKLSDLVTLLDVDCEKSKGELYRFDTVMRILSNEFLMHVFEVEALRRPEKKCEVWVRLNRCLDASNVMPRMMTYQ